MSMMLTIYPLRNLGQLAKTSIFCDDHLTFEDDYRLFGQLRDMSGYRQDDSSIPAKPSIHVMPLPLQLWIRMHPVEGIETTRTDEYDEILTFAYAEDLKELRVGATHARNVAILAFIAALPEDTPIILYWH